MREDLIDLFAQSTSVCRRERKCKPNIAITITFLSDQDGKILGTKSLSIGQHEDQKAFKRRAFYINSIVSLICHHYNKRYLHKSFRSIIELTNIGV